MRISEAIERLEREREVVGEDASITLIGLLEIVYRDKPRIVEEHKAREQMVRDVIRAKREAGFPLNSAFFRDVWPVALEVLRARNAGADGGLANAVVMPGGLVEQMCRQNERLEAAVQLAVEFLAPMRDGAKVIEGAQGRTLTQLTVNAGDGVVRRLDDLLQKLGAATSSSDPAGDDATHTPRDGTDDPQGTEL